MMQRVAITVSFLPLPKFHLFSFCSWICRLFESFFFLFLFSLHLLKFIIFIFSNFLKVIFVVICHVSFFNASWVFAKTFLSAFLFLFGVYAILFFVFFLVNIAWCLSSLHFFTNASITLFLVFISFAFFLNNLFFNLTLIAIKKKFNCFFLACLVFVSYVHMLTVIFDFF